MLAGRGALSVNRLHLGCGSNPLPGWVNVDNSPSVWLAQIPERVTRLLGKLRLLSPPQREFIRAARALDIRWADGRRLPFPDNSFEAVYSSHTLEHVPRAAVATFLAEIRRVLLPGGVLRLALPDLNKLVDAYRKDGDAEAFMERSLLGMPSLASPLDRLKFLVVGSRHHAWMYDARSTCVLLERLGFQDAKELLPGQTTLSNPAGLDLAERSSDSFYVEAIAP